MLKITVVNRAPHLPEAELRRVIRAINRQMAEHFEPAWKFGAELHLHAQDSADSHGGHVSLAELPGLHGDAVIYIGDKATLAGAEGYHGRNNADKPFGFVFLDICRQLKDNWTVCLSHEVIELAGDPMSNLLVQGPSPHDRHQLVFHMFELCDAVQGESYEIDGVQVSNFVLPGWFTRGDAPGARNDFLGRPQRGETLPSFGIAPGGYLCFWDGERDERDRWVSMMRSEDDADARRRLEAKRRATLARVARRCHPHAR